MKRGLKIVVSWLCLFSLLVSPLTASGAGTTSGDPVWPNPGAIQLSKTAEPTGKSGEWKITLKAEGKNIKSSTDVVLVIDKSGSMDDRDWWWETDYKLADARTAAKKFVDNLLLTGSSSRIAVVSFNKSATNVSDFKGPSQKDALKTSIDNISASGGTNIQAGLKNARDLLANSSAQNKVIVVLSDGEPTYSFKGTQAKSSSWQNNSYNFAISKFDYGTTLGTGGDFDLSKSSRYEINNFSVKDNGIGTISEAKLAKDAGLKIFSVGLDVSKNSNAIKVLKDVQNEGYFSANSDELNNIFREMAGKISYAAQGAKVIDPMGDMFNLKLQGAQISPADYTVSQGTVTWDAATEKFNWNVGNIAEGEPATFTYTVVMDQSKNPVSNVLYPTNGKTTMEYTNVNNQNVSKDFEVPKVSIGNGSILMKGYKVNANGKPINAEGVEVEAPEFAEALYSEYYKDQNGKEAFPMGSTHSVPAKSVAGYQLKVGESPRNVTLTVTNPTPVIWFGYTAAVEQTVTVKYLEKDSGKQLKDPTFQKGFSGSKVELKALPVEGYSVVAPDKFEYTFTSEPNQVHTFYYTANEQNVTVKYLKKGTTDEVAPSTTVKGLTGETIELTAANAPGYTPEKATDSYTIKAEGNNEYIFYYTANAQSVEVQYLEQGTNKVLADPTTANGVTGQTIELKAKDIAGYTAVELTHSYKLDVENAPHVFYYTANAQSVNVKYVDRETGKEIAEATSVDGVTGETVTLEAKDVAGYTPEKATDSYTLKAEGNEYTFYYNGEERTVEVYYLLEGTDEELVNPDTVEGVTGQKVNLEPKVIPGYTPITQGYTYTFEVENVPQYFYYTADEQSVEVQYLEQGTDKELSDPTTSNGVTGQSIELKAKDIAGYTPLELTYSYTLGVENAPHIFYYKANEPDNNRTLTVRYVDLITGNDLLDPTEHAGKVGEEITLTANDYTDSVTGAVYKPHEYSVPYTFKNEPLHDVFTFTYTQDVSDLERTVLVHHVDRESNLPLMEPTLASGKVGETILLKAGPISVADAVYMPEEFSYNYTVTLDLEQQYTIYYNLGEPSGDVVKLTISYLDRETNGEIASQEVIEGKAGTQFTLNAKNVPGYTPEVPSYDYRYSDEPNQNYVFYYTKNAPANQQLTVKYLLNGTNEQLASPSVFTGKPGETKTLTAVSISGYTPVKSTDAYTFTTQAGQEYIFYYTRNSSNPGGSGGSNTSSGSTVTPLPALPPLPAVPPTLEMENHYDYINGYPDGSVKPLNNITREEVAAIFYRLLDDESRSEYLKTGNSFSDVGATRWSNKHISTMENAGVITGYPDGTFKPGQYITRAEFAAIASRFDKLDERANDSFTDITGHWAEKYIASAANKGWIKGYTDGTFKPNQYITRAEAAAFINSVLNRKVDKDGIHEDAKMWPDNVYGKWYYYDILEATNHHDYSREEEAEVEVWEEVLPNRVYP